MSSGIVVMGIDLSLRQTGLVCLSPSLKWESSHVGVSLTDAATEADKIERCRVIARAVVYFRKSTAATHVFIEQYAFDAISRAHAIGELGGVVKYHLARDGVEFVPRPVVASQARKYLFGKLPQKGAKVVAHARLDEMGYSFPTPDEADAFIVANFGLSELGCPGLSVG